MKDKPKMASGKFVSFKRKREENPYEALTRLDKKLQQVQFELSNWITVPTVYGVSITHKLENNKQLLLAIKAELLKEIEMRHNTLLKLKPNIIRLV